MTQAKFQLDDATATCPLTWGRDGWQLDSPETETSIEGAYVDPRKVFFVNVKGEPPRSLLDLLVDAAERCDEPRPVYYRDAAE